MENKSRLRRVLDNLNIKKQGATSAPQSPIEPTQSASQESPASMEQPTSNLAEHIKKLAIPETQAAREPEEVTVPSPAPVETAPELSKKKFRLKLSDDITRGQDPGRVIGGN
jgi:hypothetical protein